MGHKAWEISDPEIGTSRPILYCLEIVPSWPGNRAHFASIFLTWKLSHFGSEIGITFCQFYYLESGASWPWASRGRRHWWAWSRRASPAPHSRSSPARWWRCTARQYYTVRVLSPHTKSPTHYIWIRIQKWVPIWIQIRAFSHGFIVNYKKMILS